MGQSSCGNNSRELKDFRHASYDACALSTTLKMLLYLLADWEEFIVTNEEALGFLPTT
jgi:hypothetical protein